MQDFGSLKLLVALLGPSLGRSDPKMVPKIAPKVVQKVLKNWSEKWTQQIPQKCQFWAPKWPQHWDHKFRETLTQASSGTLLAQDGAKMALRWLKMPKMRPRWPQHGPR